MKKKLVACLYLKDGKAVKSLEDMNVINENAIDMACYYSNNGADELLLFDLSTADAEHEQSIGIMKEIVRLIDIPMMAGGNVKRVEDVKKILYTGAKAAMLNFSKESNVEMLEEVSKRFGKEKIVVCTKGLDALEVKKDLVKEFASTIVDLDVNDTSFEKAVLPMITNVGSLDDTAFIDKIKNENVSGVMASEINSNSADVDLMKYKNKCKELGIDMTVFESTMKWSEFKLNSDGMVPVIVQDYKTNEVLMLAYMNEEAFNNTIATGKMTYWSRSRNELWVKGLTSGHFQYVKSLTMDCDNDTLLAKVAQTGAACHTGKRSCFFNEIAAKEYNDTNPLKVFEDVYAVIEDRKQNPKEGSYTNYLFDKGIDKILKKVGEEATEIIIAAKNPDPEEIKYEMSDFLYHAMVLMVERGVTWEDITRELANR